MKHLESNLQKMCVRWFRLQYPDKLIFAIPNGGARNQITGAILKAEGVLAGVPDLFIAAKSFYGEYHGLFIEMKSEKGRLTDSQKEVGNKLSKAGYKVEVCFDIEQYAKIVNGYFMN